LIASQGFSVKLMQFLVVPTFVLDLQGRVLIWNQACERLTGLAASEVVGTRDHWRGFYTHARPCLADLIFHNRLEDLEELYVTHDKPFELAFGLHAENWCEMPHRHKELYLGIDAGPIYDDNGALLAVVQTVRDISEQKRTQIELEVLVHKDELTGLHNRRAFDGRFQSEWGRASRDGASVSVLMIDVDHFKPYNDSYGHQAGDACLKQVAAAIGKSLFRKTDLACRYGGEEFSVILPAADPQSAVLVANRIRENIAALAIPHPGNPGTGVVTVSIGVACAYPQGAGGDEAALLKLADDALYAAKRAGRNQVELNLMQVPHADPSAP
jgi:diguanylate cyclase (GGDEF)-like protein